MPRTGPPAKGHKARAGGPKTRGKPKRAPRAQVRQAPVAPGMPSREEIRAFLASAQGRVGKTEIARAFGIPTERRPELRQLLSETPDMPATVVAERVGWMVSGALGGRWPVRVGVADGSFAALLAAQRAHRQGQPSVVVPPGEGPAFLAPHPVGSLLDVIEVPEQVDVWRRLGLSTLGHTSSTLRQSRRPTK